MTNGITLKKNVHSDTLRHQEERKELARNQRKDRRKIERVETFCPMVSSKWKQC
jgi:hypothetical protein